MMTRRHVAKPTPNASVTDAALEAMDAEGLRSLIREIIPWLDDSTHARLVNALVDRAARSTSGWVPDGPADDTVDKIVRFAEAATRVGQAEPSEVDDYLREGSNAFLAKDYRAAFRIFHALLLPLGNGDVDLGQHEMLDEVLGVDLAACAAQYVVSMYMTAATKNRAKAVLTAIDGVRGVGHFWEPLRELEKVIVEPLPDFEAFLVGWRALAEDRVKKERRSDWDSDEDRWLREVVRRTEGPDGLAKVARKTKRSDDLRAWCRALVEAKDWKRALEAYEEAAEIVVDKEYSRGDFLDGAALAAQELGRKDLPAKLERAWREAPSVVRLRRWLGAATTKKALRERAAAALEVCPKQATRQRALLHVLQGDFAAAAKLLASAPGLGWSNGEHPGHLLFPLFTALLTKTSFDESGARDFDELSSMADRDEPRLTMPAVATLIDLASVVVFDEGKERASMLTAMRKAAERRIEGVTENKRRRHYEHAATLALTCAAIDPDGSRVWLEQIRGEYNRYPALQRELGRGARR
jgi:tetratricopeptide (TPR) repeat protein